MQPLRDIPIKRKLTLIILATCTMALVLASMAFIAYEWFAFKRTIQRELVTQARIIGANSRAALLFNDSKSAEETLTALQAEPHVETACIYSADRKVFATYSRPNWKQQHVTESRTCANCHGAATVNEAGWRAKGFPPFASVGHQFEANGLSLFQPIEHDHERVGTVYVRCDLDEMMYRIQRYTGIVGLVLVLSSLVALLLSAHWQHLILRPILALAATARQVTESKDYAVRAAPYSHDEVGQLVDSFNAMLSEIQQRDLALRGSEEHFRSLIENASDIITLLDAAGVVSYASPSVERILGYHPDKLIGRACRDLVHPDDEPALTQHLAALIASPGTTAPVELRFRRRGGTWITFESVGNNLLANPAVNAIVVNSRDVTERKQADEKLRVYAAKLERSNRELQDFAYVASHDLQEPLRKIQAFGDRMKTRFADAVGEQGRDYLARMQDAASRMQGLIVDLLQFSRITTKAQPFVPVDLNQIALGVLSDLEVRIEQTQARVAIENLATIDADALQMRQLLQNLIGNALKFHKPGLPPVIRVTGTLRNGTTPPRLELVVTDNGIGFDQKYAERIFVIFQRLHGRGVYEGTGVGLAICKKIVERHGGQIHAQSKSGEGATFVITLPMQHSPGSDS